ncbi:MAG: HAMP domain-containing protein [Deltaproteobacteria bacterium]|nr:HAMP domain-containing protein [Deltaproteobacteria bacterium]
MTVICEECGKVYHIDPEKLEKYKGKKIKVKCGECGHVTRLSHLMEEEPVADAFSEAIAESMPSGEAGPEEEPSAPAPSAPAAAPSQTTRGGLLGLRGKMFILFLIIPVTLMLISGYFTLTQIQSLATDITNESTKLVTEAGKEQLLQKARDVALQCEIYLKAHPDLEREDFSYDPEFNQIAVQNVGKSGYTCLVQEPDPVQGMGWAIWAHPNPNIIGIDDIDLIKKALGPYFEDFWKTITSCQGRREATGPYMWKDPDGKIRAKYMAIAPIHIEGKPFSLMATSYIDEFTQKTDGLRKDAAKRAIDTRNLNLAMLGAFILIIGLIIIIYGYRLTRSIQYLTEAADRISVGDLEAEIEIKSKDEIGSLADAISRMQDSLRFSIERLRRRR